MPPPQRLGPEGLVLSPFPTCLCPFSFEEIGRSFEVRFSSPPPCFSRFPSVPLAAVLRCALHRFRAWIDITPCPPSLSVPSPSSLPLPHGRKRIACAHRLFLSFLVGPKPTLKLTNYSCPMEPEPPFLPLSSPSYSWIEDGKQEIPCASSSPPLSLSSISSGCCLTPFSFFYLLDAPMLLFVSSFSAPYEPCWRETQGLLTPPLPHYCRDGTGRLRRGSPIFPILPSVLLAPLFSRTLDKDQN